MSSTKFNAIILAKKLENIILKTKLFTSIQINPYFHAFGSKSYMNEDNKYDHDVIFLLLLLIKRL